MLHIKNLATGQTLEDTAFNIAPSGEDPNPKSSPRDSDHPNRTEEQQQQIQHTNRAGLDEYQTEGNVIAVGDDAAVTVGEGVGEPAIVIANRDGKVTVILRCGSQCPTVHVGDYVVISGEKIHELLYIAYDVSVEQSH